MFNNAGTFEQDAALDLSMKPYGDQSMSRTDNRPKRLSNGAISPSVDEGGNSEDPSLSSTTNRFKEQEQKTGGKSDDDTDEGGNESTEMTQISIDHMTRKRKWEEIRQNSNRERLTRERLTQEESFDPIENVNEGVKVSLHDGRLWRTFQRIGTEMIINRAGRRMFPHVVFSINGLKEERFYSMKLEIVPADDKRYKFVNNTWMPVGIADPQFRNPPTVHPDSPGRGSFWQNGSISFAKVRLTNNRDSAEENMLLQSMHKYAAMLTIRDEEADRDLTFLFPESTFVAVTAYQNTEVTRMKIVYNPFAKAFRDGAPFLSVPDKSENKNKKQNERQVTSTERRRSSADCGYSTSMNDTVSYGFPSNVPPLRNIPFSRPSWLGEIDAEVYRAMLWRSLCSSNASTICPAGVIPYLDRFSSAGSEREDLGFVHVNNANIQENIQ